MIFRCVCVDGNRAFPALPSGGRLAEGIDALATHADQATYWTKHTPTHTLTQSNKKVQLA